MIFRLNILVILILLSLESHGQERGQLSHVLHFVQGLDTQSQYGVLEEIDAQAEGFAEIHRRSKNDSRFLKKLFYKVQREQLATYSINSNLIDLFDDSRKYDCVTGTALYALIIDKLGFEYSIKETDHHVYLLVHLMGKDILFESTDPIYGFIDNPVLIGERIRSYRTGNDYVLSSGNLIVKDESSSSLNKVRRDRNISLKELAGLQYYNLATEAFNHGQYDIAVNNTETALLMYPNNRFEGFLDIVRINMSQSLSTNYAPKEH